MTLKYTIKKETWLCSDVKHLKGFLQGWASRTENPEITGDLLIADDEGIVTAYRDSIKATAQIVGDKGYLFDDEILDWFVKAIKAILKKDTHWTLYFNFKDAVRNAMREAGERTFLQYSDGLGFKNIVEVKGIFGKSPRSFGIKLGKKVYKFKDYLINDNEADGLNNISLERIEEDLKEWYGDKALED